MFGSVDPKEAAPGWTAGLLAVAAFAAFGGLALLVASLPGSDRGLSEAVEGSLTASGIGSQVNAVLINFRAFDTLLEKAVLLVALVGLWGLSPEAPWHLPSGNFLTPGQPEPQLIFLLKVLAPLVLLAAFYLFWLGTDQAGGAFQAGTITAALGILLVLAKAGRTPAHGSLPARWLAVAGFLVFAAVGSVMILLRRGFLNFPEGFAKPLLLLIESGVALSVTIILFLLASGLPQYGEER